MDYHKILKEKTILCLFFVLSAALSSPTLFAQTTGRVSGTVVDNKGEAIIGASIQQKGTSNGSTSDGNGKFSLSAPGNASLIISYLGYLDREIAVNNQTVLNIILEEDTKTLDEVVVVGYGTQKKVTLTGAISSIKGSDMITTVNENAQNMLTGKVPGVRVTQKTAEPGTFNNNFDIRGMGEPLIVIDGIPRTKDDFQRLDPNDIDNISVLKDASAAIYGVRSANGVVLVTTKKGVKGSLDLSYSGTFTAQVPSGLPPTVNAMEYMTLRNEQSLHNVNGGSMPFGDDKFDAYRTGAKQSTDWYPLVFSNWAPQTMHNINATGGNDRITFYAGLGYEYQEGFFKSGDLKYDKYNVRSNLSAKITDRLTFDLNLSSTMDEQERPYQDSWWIIRGFWRQGPQIPAYADPEQTMLYHGLIEGDNPLSFMDSDVCGYKKYNKKFIQTSGSLKYDIPRIKGLTAKGLFSYDYFVSDAKLYNKAYDQYQYDDASKKYTTFTRQSPSSIERQTYMKSQLLMQASLNYDNTFNKVHKVSGLLAWETQKRTSDNFLSKRFLGLPLEYLFAGVPKDQLATMNSNPDALFEDANNALIGRLNYGFSNKYLAEVLFRYDGSSKFGPDHQWGFFPAVSLGWRISEENFIKNSSLSFINQLKLRASYGITGDDAASRYQFISGYNYPTNGDDPIVRYDQNRGVRMDNRNFTPGYAFNGDFFASADHKGIPNPNITWYTSKTFNLGLDFEGWNGLFGATIEYFNRDREGLLAKRSGGIPTVVGSSLPDENINSDRNCGFEVELTHRNKIADFSYNMKGIVSLTRVERLYVERGAIGSSWSNWNNNQNDRLQGVHKGLEGAGQFESWEDIWNYPTYIGRGTILGDYKYEDWNGDGEINGNDSHPIRFNQYPWVNFSYIFDAAYKGFDFNMLWQGATMGSLIYGEQLRIPLWGNGESGAMNQFMDRWHPSNPKADPYDPSQQWIPGNFAYTGSHPDENSTFNCENGTYLRLKSIELGYTIPGIKGIKNLRVFANAYNLMTLTKVKYVDPEHPNDTYGYLYPLNKTFSIGLNLKF